jgi:Asp-tRNA(Asn)/Glu-tRNA(Gln) amidotransferase B subunit
VRFSSDPRWASFGPAVFVCDECAKTHRQLRQPRILPDNSLTDSNQVVDVTSPELANNAQLIQVYRMGDENVAGWLVGY